VSVSSSQIECRHPAGCTHHAYDHFGAARLSPDNRRLYLPRSDYLKSRYTVQCIDLATGEELWQTEWQPDRLTALDISPDGRVLACASGFADKTIRLWNAATGELLKRLDGHTSWVSDLAYTRDGRRLISTGADQTIRFWDTSTWANTMVLSGHTDEVWSIAISEPAQLIASASKDGDLMLWPRDVKSAADGYRRLSERLGYDEVEPLDGSRMLLLPPGQPPELVDLMRDSAPVPLLAMGASSKVLGCFGTNILCYWNGTNQILVGELRGAEFVQRGAITLNSGMSPTGFAYNPARQLLAWTEGTSSTSLFLESLATPGRRMELTSDVPGLVPFRFSEDGNYLAATRGGGALLDYEADTLRAWNVETGQIVASINRRLTDACFAADGRKLVVGMRLRIRNEIAFHDLAHPDREPQRVLGGFFYNTLAVSPDGGLVSASTGDAQILLLDPVRETLLAPLHGHLNTASASAFSPDGSRLFSTYGGQEAVRLWDVGTRQELLTLASVDAHLGAARWSADGNVILAGPPWQAWSAPSLEDIASAEAKNAPSSDLRGQRKSEAKQP
jgi:WD40 repeat protein